jgi:hypothetical protein
MSEKALRKVRKGKVLNTAIQKQSECKSEVREKRGMQSYAACGLISQLMGTFNPP